MNIDFIKCHGTGNDFILIDEIKSNLNLDDEKRKSIAITLCNRENSIGADGILFVLDSAIGDGMMRIFNSDGSEAEMCGNGLRCVGRYIMKKTNKDKILVETLKAKYDVKKANEVSSGVFTVEININTVNFNTKSLPMISNSENFINKEIPKFSKSLKFTALSITNPHIVTFVDEFNMDDIKRIGTLANTSKEIFPQGVNVNFVKILDNNNIYIKTFERGVGITKSCGTGMTASTTAYCLNTPSLYNEIINIYNDGGMIKIAVHKNLEGYNVKFIGNASYIYSASINLEDKNNLINKSLFKDEINAYDEFLQNCPSL